MLGERKATQQDLWSLTLKDLWFIFSPFEQSEQIIIVEIGVVWETCELQIYEWARTIVPQRLSWMSCRLSL